jgi:O-acetyl-ADP-ribose deacetylase (regulator of RNase III)
MRLEIHFGDITNYKADCIVNAARPSLLGGGGVDGAIHRKAGNALKEFCKTLNGCETGEAKLSPGFNLSSKFVIHTVGPRLSYNSNKPSQLDCANLKKTYTSCLRISTEKKFEDLIFPNISTGAYGFPKDLASKTSIDVVIDYLQHNEFPKKVVFCCYDFENLEYYIAELKKYL